MLPPTSDSVSSYAPKVGGAGLAGVLPGLGSSMIRGPYACWQLGQACELPGI